MLHSGRLEQSISESTLHQQHAKQRSEALQLQKSLSTNKGNPD